MSNYAGWLLTSFVLMVAFRWVDRKHDDKIPKGIFRMPFRSLLGPVLYLSVLIFNWTVTFLIGEKFMAQTGIFIFTMPIVLVTVLALVRVNRYREEELQEHLRDYPWSPFNQR